MGNTLEKYESSKLSTLPHSIKHSLVIREMNCLTSFEVNVLLLVERIDGIGFRNLMSYFTSGETGKSGQMSELVESGYLRETVIRGASSFQSSRKFYLTGKGRELVKRYYELMNG